MADWPDTPRLMTASLGVGDNYLLPTALVEGETVSWSTTYDAGARRRSSFGRDERCHVSFSSSSNSIIYFHYDFIMLLLCFYYAFIMLSLCFHYAFLGTRLIKVSFWENCPNTSQYEKIAPRDRTDTQIPPSTSPRGHFSNTSPKESLHYSNTSLKGK